MELFEQITHQTIVTPNRRLAATLLKRYHQYQMTQGGETWASLDCLPLQSWIHRLWDEFRSIYLHSSPLVLSQQQEQMVWEDIIKQSPVNDALLQVSATAELAKAAWSILKQWRIDFTHPLMSMTEDSRAFQQWAEQFQLLCEQNNWIDAQSLTDKIIVEIMQKRIKLPEKLIITGFTEITPLQNHLMTTCKEMGVYLQHHTHAVTERTEHFISLPDEESEIYTMARWAKTLSIENPAQPIGCVIPNLENNRDRVVQIFTEVFGDIHSFNISAGKSLTLYPIIHAAFKCLNLQTETISIESFSSLLRSPFIGEAEREYIQRANLDSRLRKANKTCINLNEITHASLFTHCSFLKKRLETFQQHFNHLPKKMSISAWINQFMQLLEILGWPGERSLNSHEYQIVQRWLDLMIEYRTFENILPEQNYQDALYHLNRLSVKTIFQPQSNDAPVQILGMLEAAELPFSYLWVMGLDDTSWPATAKPNPFITQRLQKTLQMPHATAEREFIYSTQLTEQLRKASKNVIFSHAIQLGDCELRPSSLISHFTPIQIGQLNLHDFIQPAHIIYHSRTLESLHDEYASPIHVNENIRGGVTIFKQQAACPFKAFAEMRLHAKPLESPTLGLRAQDRGTITHKALELIWQEIKNSTTLLNLDDESLKTLLNECVIQAIQGVADDTNLRIRYYTLESERLKSLLWHWLELEKCRPPFKVISQEKEQTIMISNIPVTMRVDRIDQLDDGSYLIIDYKTGKNNNIKYWFSERPDEPQLPLYCVTYPNNTTGIAFATIHPNNMALQGISKNNLNIKDIKPLLQWEQQMQTWQTILEKLGNAFYQGDARVDPKDPDETCRYCHLQALCRIHED